MGVRTGRETAGPSTARRDRSTTLRSGPTARRGRRDDNSVGLSRLHSFGRFWAFFLPRCVIPTKGIIGLRPTKVMKNASLRQPLSKEASPSPLSSRLPRRAVGPKRTVVEGPAVLSSSFHAPSLTPEVVSILPATFISTPASSGFFHRFSLTLQLKSKKEVHRNANQNDQHTRNCGCGLVHKQNQ